MKSKSDDPKTPTNTQSSANSPIPTVSPEERIAYLFERANHHFDTAIEGIA